VTLAFSPGLFALILAIYLAAGFVKGALGFGLPTVAITVLPFLIPVEEALALNALVIAVTNLQQIVQAGATREGFAAGWPMMLGMALMVPVGAVFAVGVSAKLLMTILGSFVLLFVLMSFLKPHLRIPPGRERPVGFGMGLLSGFVGALTSSPGAIFVMYAVSLHLPRPIYMATLGCIMTLFGLVLMGSYVWVGVLRWEHVPSGLLAIVPGVVGGYLGNALGARVEIETFRRIVLALLGVLAAMMIEKAVG
jgi:uncharacterized membrane protein YfcA